MYKSYRGVSAGVFAEKVMMDVFAYVEPQVDGNWCVSEVTEEGRVLRTKAFPDMASAYIGCFEMYNGEKGWRSHYKGLTFKALEQYGAPINEGMESTPIAFSSAELARQFKMMRPMGRIYWQVVSQTQPPNRADYGKGKYASLDYDGAVKTWQLERRNLLKCFVLDQDDLVICECTFRAPR